MLVAPEAVSWCSIYTFHGSNHICQASQANWWIEGLTDRPSDLLTPNWNPFHKLHVFRQRMTTSKLAMKERHLVLLHGGDCIRPGSGSKPNEPIPKCWATWPRIFRNMSLATTIFWILAGVLNTVQWCAACMHLIAFCGEKHHCDIHCSCFFSKPSRAIAAWLKRLKECEVWSFMTVAIPELIDLGLAFEASWKIRKDRIWLIWMQRSAMWVFPKIMVPQIINFHRVFHYKPSILGYPYFWKLPCSASGFSHANRESRLSNAAMDSTDTMDQCEELPGWNFRFQATPSAVTWQHRLIRTI